MRTARYQSTNAAITAIIEPPQTTVYEINWARTARDVVVGFVAPADDADVVLDGDVGPWKAQARRKEECNRERRDQTTVWQHLR